MIGARFRFETASGTAEKVPWLAFLGILGLAAYLRFESLGAASITQDESSMLQFTRGLQSLGFPANFRAGVWEPMKTYEILPFFILPSVTVFGWSEAAARVPAALFGLGTLALIFLAGRRWFDDRIALWAAFLYAICPWAIYWGRNAFYPSQTQFFAMLSTVLVYRLLAQDRVPPRHYYLIAASLCLMYLSWEASGLVFLTYALLAVWLGWRRWGFALSPHAWGALGIVGFVVVGQLARRLLLQEPYLAVGSSRAEISAPQLAMNHLSFEPYHYIENPFGSEQFLILSLCLPIGLFFLHRSWALCFALGATLLMIGSFTLLLPVQATRYTYIALPTFLIAASAATFTFVRWATREWPSSAPISQRALGATGLAILLMLQGWFMSAGELQLAKRRPDYRSPAPLELNPEAAEVDHRYVTRALAREFRPGDVVVVRGAFPLELYTGLRGDYALQHITTSIVRYEPTGQSPFYRDKWVGNPVLRNRAELEDVLLRHQRVWFLASPLPVFKQALGEELFRWVHESSEVRAEGYNVRLYLWARNVVRATRSPLASPSSTGLALADSPGAD